MTGNNNATILISDISGFTEFMTNTELSHGSYAINILIDAMIKTLAADYEVSEIEGDAVLIIRKGPAPTKQEIQQACINIFNAFHFQRKWMQQHAICPCGACLAIRNLTLKFVVHHGPVAEMRVGRFVKQSGPEMIVAHRLLKNSIDNNEYLLITEKMMAHSGDSLQPGEAIDLQWTSSSEEYPSIGKINYHFASLKEARKNIPDPPPTQSYLIKDHFGFLETPVRANFRDVYMVVMDIPGRPQWQTGLRSVEQDMPGVFIGSVHRCAFAQYDAVISPCRMTSSTEGIIYAESCAIESLNVMLLYEFEFRKLDDACTFACRVVSAGDSKIPDETGVMLKANLIEMASELKTRCEQMETSFFEPFFQKN